MTAPKTVRKISLLNNLNYHNNPQLQQTQEEVSTKLDYLTRTTAAIGLNKTDSSMLDHKKVSAQLISQIHFCRFLYKLIERIELLESVDETDCLKQTMSCIIDGKFREIVSLRGLNNGKLAIIFRKTK